MHRVLHFFVVAAVWVAVSAVLQQFVRPGSAIPPLFGKSIRPRWPWIRSPRAYLIAFALLFAALIVTLESVVPGLR